MSEQQSQETLCIDPDIEDLLRMRFNGRIPSFEDLAEAYLKVEDDLRESKQLCATQATALRRRGAAI